MFMDPLKNPRNKFFKPNFQLMPTHKNLTLLLTFDWWSYQLVQRFLYCIYHF